MTRMAKHIALAVLLASAAAYGHAQDVLLPTDWPTPLRDAANTSSTPLLPPDTLTPDWQIPTEARQNPRVYFTSDGRHLLISANKVYSASDGSLLATLSQTGGYAAITTTTIDGLPTDVLLTGNGSQFTAYNLSDYSVMWSLEIPVDPERDSSQGRCRNPTARNGVFYLTTYADERIARVVAASGEVLWKNYPDAWINGGPPAVATIRDSEGEDKERVFLTTSCYGLLALDADTLEFVWSRPDIDSSLAQCCVDKDAGVVYVHNTVDGEWLVACDALTGVTRWSAPLDHILNEPPTLGWAKYYPPDPDEPDDTLYPAVFAVTGGMAGVAGVYAFRRDNGNLLWSTTIPSDAWVAAVYCGCTGPNDTRPGRLYIAANNAPYSGYPWFGDTYVLDAFTGDGVKVLATDFGDQIHNDCPVIVDVGGTPYMYVLTPFGKIVAWKQGGQLEPPVYKLSIEASPDQISTHASATVNVELLDVANNSAVEGVSIHFFSNPAQNQGYIKPSGGVTNESGIATTTFYSQNRTGVVTVGATTPNGMFANTTITITKGGGEEPPVSGSIQGTVYYLADGKPAKKVPVKLLDVDLAEVDTATTNPRGKYSFEEVPFGLYIVWASSNGATGETAVEISQSSPSVTADVYLE